MNQAVVASLMPRTCLGSATLRPMEIPGRDESNYEIASNALGLLAATYADDDHFGPITMDYLAAVGNDQAVPSSLSKAPLRSWASAPVKPVVRIFPLLSCPAR